MQVLRQFRSYPLQSILIVLAVALGVGVVTAVAAFLTLGQRAERQLVDSLWAREITLQTRDDDLFSATKEDGSLIHEVGRLGDEPITLTEADMERARASAPLVKYAYVTSPVGIDTSNISRDGVDFLAVSKDYLPANAIVVSEGSSFTDSDYAEQRDVALVSPRLVKLMDLSDPLGEHVVGAWGDFNFEIIGVMADKGNPDLPDVLVPFRPDAYNAMKPPTFVVEDMADVDEARAQLQAFARSTWGERVSVRSQDVDTYRSQQSSTRLLIASLASLGLVSAALNIMNLLLARVFKNRRDTGILRTLGATRSTIRNRYLLDALVLGAVGGVVGVGLGYALLVVFNSYLAAADQTPLLAGSLSLLPLGVGFVSALVSSVVFSLYPALLAARSNVIESLREV